MARINKTKRQAELRAKLKKIEAELNDLQKKFVDIKRRAEDFMETASATHVHSEIKKLREQIK
jgi:predicted  nucleic acid-binding Zn-ribbon protein